MVYEDKIVRNFIKYLKAKDILSISDASDDEIEKLSQEINSSFWTDFSRNM